MATREEIIRAGYDLDNAWRGDRDDPRCLLPPRMSGRHELTRATVIFAISYRSKLTLNPGDQTRTDIIKQADPERYAHDLQRNRLYSKVRQLSGQYLKATKRGDVGRAEMLAGLLRDAKRTYRTFLAHWKPRRRPKVGWRSGRNEAMQIKPRKES